jgi:hypothetical protein
MMIMQLMKNYFIGNLKIQQNQNLQKVKVISIIKENEKNIILFVRESNHDENKNYDICLFR